MIPLFVPLAVIAPLAGRLTSRIGARLPMAGGLVISAAGLGLLVAASSHSTYALLLVAFLLWGGGLGLLTPAVVAAAIASVPKERSGLASAINNTSRQAAGAVGIAVAGAIAGQPSDAGGFVSGFHLVMAGAACVYGLTAVVDLAVVPGALLPGVSRRS